MKYIFTFLFCFLFVNGSFCQIQLSGVILYKSDSTYEPLIGAMVQEVNTDNIVLIYDDGKFSITVDEDSKISITGYLFEYDTIFAAADYSGDTIIAKEKKHIMEKLVYVERYHINRQTFIGLEGNCRMTYGLTANYYKRFDSFISNANFSYKTNFKENSDLKCLVGKNINSLTFSLLFHMRNLKVENEDFRINDYSFVVGNMINFFDFLYVKGGLIFRDNYRSNNKYGMKLGIDASCNDPESRKPRTNVIANLSYIENDFEYSVAIYQRLGGLYSFLRKFQVGLEYQKYIRYNELNLSIMYSLGLKKFVPYSLY